MTTTAQSCEASGHIPCGTQCLPSARCCLADAGWSCKDNKACYTISSTVGCYSSVSQQPTNAQTCVPSGEPIYENNNYTYCRSDIFRSCGKIVYINSHHTLTSAICAESAWTSTIDRRDRMHSADAVTSSPETTFESVTVPAYTTVTASSDRGIPTTTLEIAPIIGITIGGSAFLLLLVIVIILLRRKSCVTNRNKDRVEGGEPVPSRPEWGRHELQ